MSHRRVYSLLLILAWLGGAGCAGYRVGYKTLYRPDVATVHVPIFESDTFRRDMGERLTEAVVKQINVKTPYRVVTADRADSVLKGRILSESKNTIAENEYDIPRIYEVDLIVDVKWYGPQGELLSDAMTIPVEDFFLRIVQEQTMIPESGQSVATTFQAAIDQMAEQIVEQMEATPW
ncbi:MAG: LptE family protein [Pirellulaceae bacterium]|nr:LptE family protein [Pirellulaceae bacterium]